MSIREQNTENEREKNRLKEDVVDTLEPELNYAWIESVVYLLTKSTWKRNKGTSFMCDLLPRQIVIIIIRQRHNANGEREAARERNEKHIFHTLHCQSVHVCCVL